MSAINDAKIARAVGDIGAIETDIEEYDLVNGKLPDALTDVGLPSYLDPWGNPYEYLNHSTMRATERRGRTDFSSL